LLVPPAAAAAQQLAVPTVASITLTDEGLVAGPQSAPSRKSPTLAAILSWLVWPGVGSYYAGSSGHGTRHLLIGVGAMGAAIPLAVTCDSDGFCDFEHDAVRLSALIGLGAVWLGNSIWSIITAVNDAEQRNARVDAGTVSFNPNLQPLVASVGGVQATSLGIGLVTVRF
jgi:hypothetical protein